MAYRENFSANSMLRVSKVGYEAARAARWESGVRRHIEGEITIGLYAINPATQRCKWVAIDADYKGAMEDLVKLQHYLSEDQVQAALEMSKRGGHLWISSALRTS
jgi:hypothetical protein